MNPFRTYRKLTITPLRILTLLIVLLAGLSVTSCGSDEADKLPDEIQSFISVYFPGQEVENYTESGGVYTVNLRNSATLTFNATPVWIGVDGNGNVLPTQFLFDELPSGLYDYIETTDNLNEVFYVKRASGIYTVSFHNYVIAYNSANGDITPVVSEDKTE